MDVSFAAGGVLGRLHRNHGRNYQDWWHAIASTNRFVGVVTDGLSIIEQDHEEIPTKCEFGAIQGAHFIPKTVGELSLRVNPEREKEVFTSRPFWQRVEDDVLAHLRTSALSFGGSLDETVQMYFLFTSLGVLITPNISVFYGIGDGNFYVNGERIQLGPFPENQPPYLAHRLLSGSRHAMDYLQFKVYKAIPTQELFTFLVATDGLNDLVDAETKKIPGKDVLVGPVSQFWTDDVYFENPEALELKLRMISLDKPTVDWNARKMNKNPGLLPDDTTFIAGRVG